MMYLFIAERKFSEFNSVFFLSAIFSFWLDSGHSPFFFLLVIFFLFSIKMSYAFQKFQHS